MIINKSLVLDRHTGIKQAGISAGIHLREGNMLKGRPRVITQLLNNFRHNVQASILMMSAILMPVIIGMAGLGLDASHWMMTQRMLQNSVDAAVLAAAWETAHGMDENAQDAAEREAANNGWDATKNGTLVLSTDTDADGQPVITGVLQQKADVYLSRYIHGSDIYIATTAAATLVQVTGDGCVLALSNAAAGAITFAGNSDITASGCGMAINSNNSEALQHNGASYDIEFNYVTMVGSAQSGMNCGNGNITCNYMMANQGSTPDPYADYDPPAPTDPCEDGPSVPPNSTVPLQPGNYCSLDVRGTLNLVEGGTYYISGSGNNDSLHVNAQGALNGTNVTIILTSSDGVHYPTIDVEGGASINLTAPTTGDNAGVAIYIDRNEPTAEAGSDAHCDNKLTGGASMNITGAIYAPSVCLAYEGSHSGGDTSACTRLIANSLWFSGHSGFGNNCTSTAVQNIGQYTVKLTL